ncbi:IPT/TIG domain-containing protein [Solirubrobacter ginsenosidimutans]|uniref:IPT/TIG domain-containing protein n=1 Tax=Solirubrobacter ginsenosidimutans TaxID=490573 RepID=A0A9X3N3S4_9ACTN|nr:IPT/TIG domain-containing protein [Solirubrobacter ginsenosidimutans]MDA0166460.1 IPT/TIG domain-containing protein [Solirubrobacter ginsenosidimutans]
MVLRPRTRPLLRRAVAAAALGALLVPAVADAKAKPKTPVITKVTPKTALVGNKLTITGKHFTRGKAKNSVLFRRDKGKALFVKADVSTTKKIVVVLPPTLEKYMNAEGATPVATRFRLRVLAAKLSKAYTPAKISPVIGPAKANGTDGNSGGAGVPTTPDGDCDNDGVKNGVDLDDDNDLLADDLELSLALDPCSGDTDGDGVEDGFEYQSAIDLNNDDYQHPNYSIPYPAKTAYPNPLFKDADKDYDGDGLDLADEYHLWKYTYEVNHTATRTLVPLSYSDGAQYSLSVLAGGNGRRTPTMNVTDYQPPQAFRAWAASAGYAQPFLPAFNAQFDLYDMDHDGVVTTVPKRITNPGVDWQRRAELTYWDLDFDGKVSDDERDEDADGLTNYDEVLGPMTSGWWSKCYSEEGEYPITYVGTKAYDADSDGDGILDGADDQDFDDIPNIMELSRNMAGNKPLNGVCGGSATYDASAPAETYVNPFNPCLPDVNSRTCQRHPMIGAAYGPFVEPWQPKIRN